MTSSGPTYIFDFDSTIVSVESLDELAAIALCRRPGGQKALTRLKEITRKGMEGKISFDESLRQRLKLFKSNRDDLCSLIGLLDNSISKSFLKNASWIKENQDRIYVVSGGFKDYMMPVIKRLNIKEGNVYANEFTYDEKGFVTGFNPDNPLSRAGGKSLQIEKLDLPKPRIIIGDAATDFEVRKSGHAEKFCAYIEFADRQFQGGADMSMPWFDPARLSDLV
jgi:D-3-phosphoglycerate dehydrogenase / 2-oxoglutarate reductase